MTDLATDILIVGAGGAGMYAAIAAARAGAEHVLLADKSLVGRGGATIMAQMTVAAGLAEECPDDWQAHLDDTLAAGRGLCDENLAEVLCRDAPARIRHTRGKSTPDLLRMRVGEVGGAPDAVLLPESHDEVLALLRTCTAHRLAVVPFGGGTSVVGGVECPGAVIVFA